MQITPTPAFSLESLDFVFDPYYSRPGENIYYTVRHGDLTIAVRIVCVDCVLPCGPRSNLNLVHFMWSTFAYCSNYAIVVVPSRTSGDKILYVRHKAEIGREDSRTCRQCIWDMEDPRLLYNVVCQKPNPCACILCSKQSSCRSFCFSADVEVKYLWFCFLSGRTFVPHHGVVFFNYSQGLPGRNEKNDLSSRKHPSGVV